MFMSVVKEFWSSKVLKNKHCAFRHSRTSILGIISYTSTLHDSNVIPPPQPKLTTGLMRSLVALHSFPFSFPPTRHSLWAASKAFTLSLSLLVCIMESVDGRIVTESVASWL